MNQLSVANYQLSEIFNPLTEAAKPLFVLANAMRDTTSNLTVEELLNKFVLLINEFEENAEKNRANYDSIKAAKYCLCTFIDEMAAKAGWSDEIWAQKSLLVTIFNETWGGERFFEILDNCKQDVEKNLYLLEFIFVCLQFDYKGKYQVLPNGDITLNNIKQELINIINNQRPNKFDTLLAKHASDQLDTQQKSHFFIPLWVIAVLAAVILASIYFLLQISLGGYFNQVSKQINHLNLPTTITHTPLKDSKIKTIRLEPLLANEIARKLVEVKETSDRSTVTILGDGLFESGSENIQNQYFPVLAVIGQALESAQGQVVVTGYTDDTPIKSINFPSNWHLSQARADAVKDILLKYMTQKDRIRSEGRGDTNPVLPNTSPENKAKNRRVEITLFTTGEGAKLASSVEENIIE